jgi:hypothetical protein
VSKCTVNTLEISLLLTEFTKIIRNKILHVKKLRGFSPQAKYIERLCGPMVGVPGYRSRGPGFLRSSGSGTWSTQYREDNWGAT